MTGQFALTSRLVVVSLTLATASVTAPVRADPPKPADDQRERGRSIPLMDQYEFGLGALRAEHRKLKQGKSTLFEVHRLANDVRDLEIKMSSTKAQRAAALARYAFLVRELEDEAVNELDRAMTAKWREEADFELNRAKIPAGAAKERYGFDAPFIRHFGQRGIDAATVAAIRCGDDPACFLAEVNRELTSRPRIAYDATPKAGQPLGASNGSHPLRSETNPTSSVAGWRR